MGSNQNKTFSAYAFYSFDFHSGIGYTQSVLDASCTAFEKPICMTLCAISGGSRSVHESGIICSLLDASERVASLLASSWRPCLCPCMARKVPSHRLCLWGCHCHPPAMCTGMCLASPPSHHRSQSKCQCPIECIWSSTRGAHGCHQSDPSTGSIGILFFDHHLSRQVDQLACHQALLDPLKLQGHCQGSDWAGHHEPTGPVCLGIVPVKDQPHWIVQDFLCPPFERHTRTSLEKGACAKLNVAIQYCCKPESCSWTGLGPSKRNGDPIPVQLIHELPLPPCHGNQGETKDTLYTLRNLMPCELCSPAFVHASI